MKTKENHCPGCKNKIDGCTPVDGENVMPKKDDITVCIYCSMILSFNADLTLKVITDEQIGELPHDVRQDLQKIRRTIKSVMT